MKPKLFVMACLFLFFILFLTGCSNSNVVVKNIQNGEAYHCKYYKDENVQWADCNFITELGNIEGKVILTNNTLYLYNKRVNQAVVFNEIKPIFGFVFPKYLNLSDGNYEVNYTGEPVKKRFQFTENTRFIKEEDMNFVVN